MKLVLRPALAGTLLLTLAACAGSPPQWTAPPESPVPSAPPSAAASGEPSSAPSSVPSTADPSVAPSATPSGVLSSADPSAVPSAGPPTDAPSGGPARVIELALTLTIQIQQGGAQVTDIPVTPGEHIRFRIDNQSFHNFWIGPGDKLAQGQTQGLVGIPDWSTEVRELDWTVPDDVTGLRFGCTIVGHYQTMNGSFSVAQ